MYTVRNILNSKGRTVWSINPQATIYQALLLMAEKEIGALLVMHENTLVGIFSERDYARKRLQRYEPPQDLHVSDLMTQDVVTAHPGQRVGACMALMTEKRVRHLPVLEGSKVVGIISIGDVVKAIIEEQRDVINELGAYLGRKE